MNQSSRQDDNSHYPESDDVETVSPIQFLASGRLC